MSRFFTFVGKEAAEMLRTKRFIILGIVFLVFAILGPLLARYIMEFINMFMPGDEVGSLVFEVGEPTWIDAYSMYYSNVVQMGVFAIIFMFMGLIFDEKRRGTAALMMMKGVKHHTFILAKFTVVAIAMLIIVILSTLVAHLYTYILFEEAAMLADAMFGALAFWVFSLFMSSLVIFFSTIAKSMVMSAMMSIMTFFGIILIDLINNINTFAPYSMASRALSITFGEYTPHLWSNVVVTTIIIAVLLIASIFTLRKQEI